MAALALDGVFLMCKSAVIFRGLLITVVSVAALITSGGAQAQYSQTNLVSDIVGLAKLTDPNLKNPWGISHTATSPFWISDQGANTATLYAVTGSTNVAPNPLIVAIPTTAAGPQGPTGQVNNGNTSSFLINGLSARFIFANLNGTISGWNGVGTNAVTQVITPGAVYTGLAINQSQTQLYAASSSGINVFDSSFAPVALGSGSFAMPAPISGLGLVPFNVQNLNGSVYVTYAPAGRPAQTNATPGQGAVSIFSESGTLQQTILDSHLAAPWGVTVAPASFGPFGGDLLVGNFSYADSEINAFDSVTGQFDGSIPISAGVGNTPGGLWSLGFGTGGNNGSPEALYFTDGINGEANGLFGAISSVPGPTVGTGFPGLVVACAGLAFWARRRRHLNWSSV
jgi:uncharacterized protein (TIGR03118 family)